MIDIEYVTNGIFQTYKCKRCGVLVSTSGSMTEAMEQHEVDQWHVHAVEWSKVDRPMPEPALKPARYRDGVPVSDGEQG